MEIKGLIEDKKIKTGENKNKQPYKLYIFTVDKKDYSTFNKDIGEVFNKGDNVTITGEQKGQYFEMKGMIKTENEAVETKKMPEAPVGNIYMNVFRRIKVLEMALSISKNADEAVAAAQKFLDFVEK